MRVVISQSMLFPWVGMLEQVRLADIFVHYDDVQFSKGSFVNRVQLKTARGQAWLTIPTQNLRLGQQIDAVEATTHSDWRTAHRVLLADSLGDAPHYADVQPLIEAAYAQPALVGAIARTSLRTICAYFGLQYDTRFIDSAELGISGSGSERVLRIVQHLGGSEYITGHGAARYLDHELFESHGIRVMYMDYRRTPYPQLHGTFDPHVSSLDLAANCGRDGATYICSEAVYWRDFLK